MAQLKSRAASGVTTLQAEEPQEGPLVDAHGNIRGWRSSHVSGGRVNPFLIQHDITGEEKRRRLFGGQEPKPHPLDYKDIRNLEMVFASPRLRKAKPISATAMGTPTTVSSLSAPAARVTGYSSRFNMASWRSLPPIPRTAC